MARVIENGARVADAADVFDPQADMFKLAWSGVRWFVGTSSGDRDTKAAAFSSNGFPASTSNPLYCYRSDLRMLEFNIGSGWGPVAATAALTVGGTGWTPNAVARRAQDGRVTLSGYIVRNSDQTSQTIGAGGGIVCATLPAGFRPTDDSQSFLVDATFSQNFLASPRASNASITIFHRFSGWTIAAGGSFRLDGISYMTSWT